MEIPKQTKDEIVSKIKEYFDSELDQDIGQFDAEFLLEFFVKEIGPFFYNQGLFDARGVIQHRVEEIDDGLLSLEKVTE